MYDYLLPEQREAFAKAEKEYAEAKQKYLAEARKYGFFANKDLLSSPPVRRAAYSDRTAWAMACMAQLAYYPFEVDDVSLALFVSKLDSGGFTLVEKFDVRGTQAFLAQNEIYAVLAFRGTEKNWRDVQADLRTYRRKTEGGRVHAGFYDAYGLISQRVREKLAEVEHLPLYITGHSLGGALATLATQDLEKSGFKDQIAACYTYGSPRVGNAFFDATIKSPIYRIINFIDIVTFVPLLAMGFIHVGDLRYLNRGFPDQVRRWLPLSQRVYFLISLFSLLVPAIGAHGIQNYVDKLERIALGENVGLMMAIAQKENVQFNQIEQSKH